MSLERRIATWERRSARLQRLDDRWVALRAAIFFGTPLFAGLIHWLAVPRVPAAFLGLGVLLFVYATRRHSRVIDSRAQAGEWMRVLQSHRARRDRDWSQMPALRVDGAALRQLMLALNLDAKNAADLDFGALRSPLRWIDCTGTAAGFARLLDRLLRTQCDAVEIATRQNAVRTLRRRSHFRRRFELLVRNPEFGLRFKSLQALAPEKTPVPRAALWGCTILAALNLGLALAWLKSSSLAQGSPLGTALGLGVAAQFIWLNWAARDLGDPLDRAANLVAQLRALRPLLKFLERARWRANEGGAATLEIFQREPRPSGLERDLRWSAELLSLRANALMHFAVHLAVPLDLWASWYFERRRESLTRQLPLWMESIAELEVQVSLGNYAAAIAHETHCWPESSDLASDLASDLGAELRLISVRHPLLPAARAVANSLELDAQTRCALVTGSNMAGKSTFLRTVALNGLLAAAGAPVTAARWRWAPAKIYCSLRAEDSLDDALSSFSAEVHRLAEIYRGAADELPGSERILYFIDEVFRGTNNVERRRGASALVVALARSPRALGILTTHDLELASLGDGVKEVRNFHFAEEYAFGKMTFPYEMREGPCPTTNALRIMESHGLPVGDSPI